MILVIFSDDLFDLSDLMEPFRGGRARDSVRLGCWLLLLLLLLLFDFTEKAETDLKIEKGVIYLLFNGGDFF